MSTKSFVGWTGAAFLTLGLVALAAPSGAAQAAEPGRWVHVRVTSRGSDNVRVNVPIAALESLASAVEAKDIHDGRIQLGREELDGVQLRKMWKAVRDSRDMEFVTVESEDETVRVAKSGGLMLATVKPKRGGHGGQVEVRVPLDVVDALLDAPDGQINFQAALQALQAHDGEALVSVKDEDDDVRIWIDSRGDAD